MGSIGNCCCETSGCCGEPNTLPTITVEGQTRSSGILINGSLCCWDYVAVTLDKPWTDVKTSATAFDERSASAAQDTYLKATEVMDVTGSVVAPDYSEGRAYVNGVLVPLCDNAEYLCHTANQNVTERLEQNMYVVYKRAEITVAIFRVFAKTAEDASPVCRWFVVSSLQYSGYTTMKNNNSFNRAFTGTSDGCCQATGLGTTSQAAVTPTEIFDLLKSGGIDRQAIGFRFYSAKTYLTLPTGDVTFSAGETVTADFGLNSFGAPIQPCVSVTRSSAAATVTSSPIGPFPIAWTAPSVSTASRAGVCITTIRFSEGGCRVAIISESGGTIVEETILPGTRVAGGGQLLLAGFLVTPTGTCNDAWCSGGWNKVTKTSVLQRDVTSSRTFQNYTDQIVTIAGGSWTVTL